MFDQVFIRHGHGIEPATIATDAPFIVFLLDNVDWRCRRQEVNA